MKHFIYKITNLLNNKSYIGQTINVDKRKKSHFYLSSVDDDKKNISYIHRSIRKYGEENFIFDVIDECDSNMVDDLENYFILTLDTLAPHGYNLINSSKQYRIVSLETRRKLQLKNIGKKSSEETKRKISKAHLGKKISEKQKKHLSETRSGSQNPMYGKVPTEETREKLSKSQRKRSERPLISDEHREKMLSAPRVFVSGETKNKIIEIYKVGKYTKKDIAIIFDLKPNKIVDILRNKDLNKLRYKKNYDKDKESARKRIYRQNKLKGKK